MRSLVCLLVVVSIGADAKAQRSKVPLLGSQVPKSVMMARVGHHQCLTDVNHHDPCSSIKIRGLRFTIAWDAHTKDITYIFTDDRRLVTDSELGVGGAGTLVDEEGKPYPVAEYVGWLITPYWSDTTQYLSDDAIWYAALRRGPGAEDGTVVAFVQSRYLKLPQEAAH